MPKGVSAILASVLIVLVTISLSGAFLVYTQRTGVHLTESGTQSAQALQQQLDVQFILEGVSGSQASLRNIGDNAITYGTLSIFLDDVLINYTLTAPIQPGQTGTLYLNQTWKAGLGERTLRVTGRSLSDSVRVRIDRPSGNVLDLRLDEGQGGTARDSSGSGNDGTVLASGRNLMKNTGFESGSSYWAFSGAGGTATTTTAQSHSGTTSVALTKAGAATYPSISQEVTSVDGWTEGRTLTISVWVKGSEPLSQAFEFFIESTYLQCGPHRVGLKDVTTEWQRYEFTHTLSSSHTESCTPFRNELASGMRVGVGRSHPATDSATVWFDDFQIEIGSSATPFTDSPWVDGRVGKALEFDGVDDHVALGNPASLQITGSQTIEMWLNPADLTARRNPYNKAYGGEGTLTLEPAGDISYYYGTGGGDSVPYQGIGSGFTVSASEWTHVVITRDLSSMRVRWYKNGQKFTDDAASFSSATASGNPAYVGKGYVNNFKGLLDEVRVYNRAYAPDELYIVNRA